MLLKIGKTSILMLGMTLALGALAQNQGQLSQRLKNASSKINEEIQVRADYMQPADQREVLELFRRIREKLNLSQNPSPYPNPGGSNLVLVESQNSGLISRKKNGEWSAVYLSGQQTISQINLRAQGSSKVRIYAVQAVDLQGQRYTLNISPNVEVLTGGSVVVQIPGRIFVRQIEILAEAWSNDMSLVVDVYVDSQNGGQQPYPTPPPDNGLGYSCLAACKNSDGSSNLRYIGSGSAKFKLEAENNALVDLKSKFSCGNGSVIAKCSQDQYNVQYQSVAACMMSNSKDPNYRYMGELATDKNETMAVAQALGSLNKSYSCGSGATYKSELKINSASYCIAACASSDGSANLNYSKGASGSSRMEAEVNALKLLNSAYSCGSGVVIHKCE